MAVLCAIGAAACTPLPGTGTPGTGVPVGGGSTATTTPKPTPTPIPTPKPTSAIPASPGTVLQYGMTSNAVLQLQQKLAVSPATGYFGTLTLAAVQAFQTAHGLTVDGQVGPQTWAAIFGSPTPTSAPTSSVPKAPAYPAIIRPAGGLGAKAVALAAGEAGKPYLWGAAGPNAFDCSGLTMFVYAKLGVALQRSANDQFLTTLHVPYSQAQPGDLIFFYDTTGYVYHVGIYAGNGMMWDAPNSTTVVRYEDVWYPNQVWVGVPGAKLAS
ncbi:MAG TPA: NlpC/P60 family protein [Frankiaceae bacterium]|nr:NlpC/P60 family protein [Frankiaceae bacterium]